MDKETRREIILDNYQHPMHKGLIEDKSYKRNLIKSDSCIDRIDMMMKIEDGIIKDILFDGEACAICTSATSIFIRKLIGKDLIYAEKVISEFNKMINEEEYDKELLGELNAYYDIGKQPSRIKCARLPFDTLEKTIKIYEEIK
jgi:nitrogen fixation NifU-like protein